MDKPSDRVYAAASQSNDELVVTLSLMPLAFADGAAVLLGEGDGGLIEDRLSSLLPLLGVAGSAFGRIGAVLAPSFACAVHSIQRIVR